MLLFSAFFSFGCDQGLRELSGTEFNEPALADCLVSNQRITNAPCVLNDESLYLYQSEYGGRSRTLSNASLEASAVHLDDGSVSLRSVIENGWSDGNALLSLSLPTALRPENIVSGVEIFGVMGTFVTPQKPACNMAASQGLQSTQCTLDAGRFAYSTAYNGRAATCTLDGEADLSTGCYVSTSKTYYLVPFADLTAVCTTGGYQSTDCRARSGQFYYSTNYGGRAANCTSSSGNIKGPCWMTIGTPTDIAIGGSGNTSTCQDNRINSSVCMTLGARYVYTAEYNGRAAVCTTNNTGNCYINSTTKSSLETQLVSTNIKAGISIFGVTGSFGGENMWLSGAAREQGATPLPLSDEVGAYAGSTGLNNLPNGFYEVPFVSLNDDGHYSASSPGESTISPVNRSGWNNTTCGLSGNISTRKSDCAAKLGGGSVWDGYANGTAGQSKWVLVSRSGNVTNGSGQEVWQDTATGLLWSSLVAVSTNWCKASGSNNSSAVTAAQFKEDDPDDICDNSSFQSTSIDAVSACFENSTGFTTADPAFRTTAKSGLDMSSTPKVNWRIPTLADYEIAEYNGIRFVLPDMGVARSSGTQFEWTGTASSTSTDQAWVVESKTGSHSTLSRSENINVGVRCIGR